MVAWEFDAPKIVPLRVATSFVKLKACAPEHSSLAGGGVGDDRVTESSVLHATPANPDATIVGDLASGAGIPEQQFDAAILTQVLQCIFRWEVAQRM